MEKGYIPKSKDDMNAISLLLKKEFKEIENDVPSLLEWMQDMHWEVGHGVSDYLQPYFSLIQEQIAQILKMSKDGAWEYNLLSFLVQKHTNEKFSDNLLNSMNRIISYPINEEIDYDTNILTKEIIDDYNNKHFKES